jgi:hypothetical protein
MGSCCDHAGACVFAHALRARTAVCELSQRQALAERDVLVCSHPVARSNCGTLAALLHERARFALRLPPPGRPLMHAQAMRLHCGGLAALQADLGEAQADVHRLVGQAQARHGSLMDLPWDQLVAGVVAWQPRRRGAAR